MNFIVSIDIEIIMSIDTITLVYIYMKKRNLHEDYCVYRHKDCHSTASHTSQAQQPSNGRQAVMTPPALSIPRGE